MDAELIAITAEIYSIKAVIDGMKATNDEAKIYGALPVHSCNDFLVEANKLDSLAKRLRELKA